MDGFILNLLTNVLLLVGIASIFSILLKKAKDFTVGENIITGIFVGAVMIAIMSNSFTISEEIFIDARTIVIASAGMFFGLIPTIIGAVIGIAFRIFLGGHYILAGGLWIFSAGLFGLLFKYYYFRKKASKNRLWYEYLVFATFLQFVMLIIFYIFVPQSEFADFQGYLIFALLILFPLAHTFLALFMEFNINRVKRYYKMLAYEHQYRSVFQQGKTMQFLLDPSSGQILDANDMAVEKYGYTYEELISMNIAQIDELSKEELSFELERAFNNKKNYFEFKHQTKSGEILNVEVYTGPVVIEDVEYLHSTVIDVTEREFQRKMYLDTNEQLHTTLKLIDEVIYVTDEYHNIIIANDKGKILLEIDELPKKQKIYNTLQITSKNEKLSLKEKLKEVSSTLSGFTADDPWILKDKYKTIDISFSISPIIKKGQYNGSVLMIRDITKELTHKEEIQYVSYHDYLTGLYNRHFFETELKRLNTKRQLPLTLFIADVNQLKLINDAFGHLEGDELIKEVANILKKSVRTEDILARWGGDEFAILLPQTNEADAGIVYQRIQKLLQRTTYEKFTPSLSIGHATKTNESTDMNTLLKIAEERMYEQKTRRSSTVKKDIIDRILTTLIEDGIEPVGHLAHVKETMTTFMEHLELSDEEKTKLLLLGKYHDIGKISTLKDTLLKSSPLSKKERQQINNHPIIGSKLISVVDDYKTIAKEISMSHEHYNGEGYPYGLEGYEIPKLVRIFSIVEAYSIMVTGTIYKGKLSEENALEQIEKEAGHQFDPFYAEQFVKIFSK